MISVTNLFEVGKTVETGKTVENKMKKDDGDQIKEKKLDEKGKPRMDGTGPRGMGRRMNQPSECRENK